MNKSLYTKKQLETLLKELKSQKAKEIIQRHINNKLNLK